MDANIAALAQAVIAAYYLGNEKNGRAIFPAKSSKITELVAPHFRAMPEDFRNVFFYHRGLGILWEGLAGNLLSGSAGEDSAAIELERIEALELLDMLAMEHPELVRWARGVFANN